jgi:23S rRNA pseudouridine1911/1915/1917 synthase
MQSWLIPKHFQGSFRIQQSVLVNGAYLPMSAVVPAHSQVQLNYTAAAPSYVPSTQPLPVVYEDQQLLIVNKPAGLKTHPNRADEIDTAVNRATAYLHGPVFITHRLDMETSGLLLFAKDPLTQAIINRQLATKTMRREYTALTAAGIPASGTIDAPIAHASDDVRKRTVAVTGLAARTHYQRLSRNATMARVALQLDTGRTHQIRVHLASIGFPIIGDPLYGNQPAPRLYLHATHMRLTKPFSAQTLQVDCPPEF